MAEALREHGFDVQHVRDLGLHAATDATILGEALQRSRILVTLDGDFAALLAHAGALSPSVIHLRTRALSRPEAQCAAVLRAFEVVGEELARGAIVSIRGATLRCRELPIAKET